MPSIQRLSETRAAQDDGGKKQRIVNIFPLGEDRIVSARLKLIHIMDDPAGYKLDDFAVTNVLSKTPPWMK
jgi:hypothetical protein